MDTRARHLLAEYHGCDRARLDDVALVEKVLRRAAAAAGARVVAALFHRLEPQGVSGVLVVEESHLSIHTHPEQGYAAVDVFTCGASDPEEAHWVVADGIRARRSELLSVDRGLGVDDAMRLGTHWLEGDAGAAAAGAGGHMFHGPLTDGWQACYTCHGVLVDRQTAVQRVTLLDTEAFGRALLLDSDLTSTAADEYIYHEALVHPAMARVEAPRRVLILGGCGGGTLREVLRWPTVEQAVAVELDRELVEICRAHLGDVYGDAYADPRATLYIGDGRAYVERSLDAGSAGFDVIVVDMPDATPSSPVRWLYTREFYEAIRRALRPGGVVIAQGGALGDRQHRRLLATFGEVFGSTATLEVSIPSYSAPWCNVLGGASLDRSAARVDAALAAAGIEGLGSYDGAVDERMRALLPALRDGLADGGVVWTDALLAAEGVPRPRG